MKIALFTDTFYDANGVSRFLQDMNRCAREAKRELRIFTSTLKSFGEKSGGCVNPPPFFRMAMPFYPQLDLVFPPLGALRKAFEAFEPDIVHISTPGPVGIYGKRLAKKAGLPIVATYHTDFPSYLYDNTHRKEIEKFTYATMRRFYGDFDRVLTRSGVYRPIVHRRVGVDQSRCRTLEAGTDTERFHPRHADRFGWEEFGIPRGGIKILYVGRLSWEKNFDFLLEVWREFRRRSQVEASLIIAGNGRMEAHVRGREEEGIFYLGHRAGAELSFLYAAADLFVTPSTTETLGQTILEAMASATPVIVSSKGGHLDFVGPECGRIVASMQKEDWLRALRDLAEDRRTREHFSRAAFRRGQTMNIQKSFEDFWKNHQEVLSMHRSGDEETHRRSADVSGEFAQ